MQKKRSISTITDVAKKAGVSTTTVSHVINKTRYVSKELVDRVNAVIEELNYQPSSLARSLRTRSSGTIGIVIPDNTNPFFAEVVRGIEGFCYEQGYSVFLCNSDGRPDKEYHYLQLLIEKNVDGLVLVSSGDDQDSQELLAKAETPCVIIDREVELVRADSVLIDNHLGGYMATTHLVELGHRSIGCITGPSQVTPSWQRRQGYTQALVDNGIEVDESLVIPGDFKSASGYDGLFHLMKRKSVPTAVFVCNDIMAIGAMAAAREMAIDVPEELSIVGFDNIALASWVVPQLTTIAQPKRELGETGAELLLKRIKKENSQNSAIVLRPNLVVRQSTAAVAETAGKK